MQGPRGLPLSDAAVLLEDLIALSIELHNPTGLHALALAIASAHNLPAKTATWDGITIIRLECGKIADLWSEGDSLGLRKQLGLVS